MIRKAEKKDIPGIISLLHQGMTKGARGMTTKKKRKPHDDFRFFFLSLGNRSMTCPRDLFTADSW